MRSVAIITGVDTHLDHLGVLSDILRIPLIVTEDKTFALAKKYYPTLNVHLRYLSDLSLDFLAVHFDVIFGTAKFWAADLKASLNLFFNKEMRFVFCPHGNSDKGHSIHELISQDISLVYGEHLIDILKHNGSFDKIKKIVPTGNYRLSYYEQHKAFYDQVAQEVVFDRFSIQKPIVLYAPTWSNAENPSSFLIATEALIAQLTKDFNLLIKLHPFLVEQHPAHTYALTQRYVGHPSVLFLTDFPPIYPLLEKSACYIGDYSSIGYDFLKFNRPLFFIPSPQSPSIDYVSPLSRCGTALPSDLSQIREHITFQLKSLADPYSELRQQTYTYAFGNKRSFESLREDVFNASFG